MTADLAPNSVEDRAVGCLLGLAIGDALGTSVEFYQRDSYSHLTGIVGGGFLKRQPGEWTDDTATALALATSLLEHDGMDERDFLERLVEWLHRGAYSCVGKCDDIGRLTRRALTTFLFSGNVRAGRTDRNSAGNGSLVRMAPVAIRYWNDPVTLCDVTDRQSRCTHGAQEVLAACQAFGSLLADAIGGAGRSVLEPRAVEGTPLVTQILAGSWQGRERRQIDSGGWVIDTLQAALWSAGTTRTFEDAVLLAANLGRDADTTAAAAGQLAGAIYGVSAIPEALKRPIAWREHIENTALQLAEAAAA